MNRLAQMYEWYLVELMCAVCLGFDHTAIELVVVPIVLEVVDDYCNNHAKGGLEEAQHDVEKLTLLVNESGGDHL
jgi:hypothetical protein